MHYDDGRRVAPFDGRRGARLRRVSETQSSRTIGGIKKRIKIKIQGSLSFVLIAILAGAITAVSIGG